MVYEPKIFYFEFFHTKMLRTKKLTPLLFSLFLEKSVVVLLKTKQNKTRRRRREEEGILYHIIYQ